MMSLAVGTEQLSAELEVNNVNTNMNTANIRMNNYSFYSYSRKRIWIWAIFVFIYSFRSPNCKSGNEYRPNCSLDSADQNRCGQPILIAFEKP